MNEAKRFLLLVGGISGILSLALLFAPASSPTIRPTPAESPAQEPIPDATTVEVTSLDGDTLGSVPVLKIGNEWVGSGTVAGVPVEVRTGVRESLDHHLPGLPPVNLHLDRPPIRTR